MSHRFVGIDAGTETLKVAELTLREPDLERTGLEWTGLEWTGRWMVEHGKQPRQALAELLGRLDWDGVRAATACGRYGRLLDLERAPDKQARAGGYRLLGGPEPAVLVSIGAHGFSVLELDAGGPDRLRSNSRCSQGTGSFLRQLVERFGLTVAEADALCRDIDDPAPLSGRCPVILKTDMTHLANRGENHARILAGLFDAVSDNVQALIKHRGSPAELVLLGGVSRSARVARGFARFARHRGLKLRIEPDERGLWIEALGAAHIAAELAGATGSHRAAPVEAAPLRRPPPLERLLHPPRPAALEHFAPLAACLHSVHRLEAPGPDTTIAMPDAGVVLGFDIGSTGSKLVALEPTTGPHGHALWEGYVSTSGDPVGAAQRLVQQLVAGPAGSRPVLAFGATGSGREIVGSLLATCYGADRVLVLNEIAAHAEGARHHDPRVDTIFEIGGQDAKYIRLSDGRVVDAAMNEACSAGTGSFIEEQGRRFAGVSAHAGPQIHGPAAAADSSETSLVPERLSAEAMAARHGVSLGQHCSVFMAEVIDQAIADGEDRSAILAGIYDSIVQNYLNRVKGSRPVGRVVLCQGMPFAAPALAAAVARQTGCEVIVPPNPGTVGALGIALLATRTLQPATGADQPASSPARELEADTEGADMRRFLEARVTGTDELVCSSTQGCGEISNHCRIARLTTVVDGTRQRFTWGGGCSLWDSGIGRARLPAGTPNLFTERERVIDELLERSARPGGRPRVALLEGLQYGELLPFLITFLDQLGLDPIVVRSTGAETLRRGIEEAVVPYCAPMQLMHGLAARALEQRPDMLFLPMLRGRVASGGPDRPGPDDEPEVATLCPLVQAAPDLLRTTLLSPNDGVVIAPVLDMGHGDMSSTRFAAGCRRAARALGIRGRHWHRAYQAALAAQAAYDAGRRELGMRALELCQERSLTPVVVLGRPYTLYDRVLSSNVPALLREQGALAIPVDCFPIGQDAPRLEAIYWSHGRRNLRAAAEVRRTPGVWSLWCSNYSCGPDSFNLGFYAHLMQGKPFAIIETDGHSGDAGTKTRIEAFLHCVREDRHRHRHTADHRAGRGFRAAALLSRSATVDLGSLQRRGERVVVPAMGPNAGVIAACLDGAGVPAEALPLPTRKTLSLGRRQTSGKECLPMIITVGSLLERLEQDGDTGQRLVFFMPSTRGPCRFGVYNLLHRIVLDRLGLGDRVRLWSPLDESYFEGLPAGFSALVLAGFAAMDALLEGLHHVRPVECRRGAANEVFERASASLLEHLRHVARSVDLASPALIRELTSGSLLGLVALIEQAATELAALELAALEPGVPEPATVKAGRHPINGAGAIPTVALAGEIYLRCDPFANDLVIERLEERGLRVHLAPFTEWLEYSDLVNRPAGLLSAAGLGARIGTAIRRRVLDLSHDAMACAMGWPRRIAAGDAIRAARPWIRPELHGEAILTVGAPLEMWRQGRIDGVVTVAPLECMPGKIAEAQLVHAARAENMPLLALSLHGEPADPEPLDAFAFEVRRRLR